MADQKASKFYHQMENCVTIRFGMKVQIILVGIPIIFFFFLFPFVNTVELHSAACWLFESASSFC
jgi:hypothetical protein